MQKNMEIAQFAYLKLTTAPEIAARGGAGGARRGSSRGARQA
jgi:hypothetical protein